MDEYASVARAVSDCVMACLWKPDCHEANCETAEHIIHAWKEKGEVKLIVRHK